MPICMPGSTCLFTLTRMATPSPTPTTSATSSALQAKPIRFFKRGEVVTLNNVPPTRTLLQVLREDLACTGTKEGCGEGDCGACTVVLGEADFEGRLNFQAVNSCIRLAHSIDGLALWTVEDLASNCAAPAQEKPTLHPAQEAMVQCHGSQCGFCTPGFVMSLFAMYQNHVAHGKSISRALAQRELSGNLCRCTGYRPILDAAQSMHRFPSHPLDEAAVLAQLAGMSATTSQIAPASYHLPEHLSELLALRAARPQAQLVAGCTDVGLWINKLHMDFSEVLDLTRVRALRQIVEEGGDLVIGAAASLEDALNALSIHWPQLSTFAARFAGLPVRNSGTLGGNVANGSPIGDTMPLLIAVGAQMVLMSTRGERRLALDDFYTGYRKNVLAPDEVLAFIRVPLEAPGTAGFLRAYKISKRYDDDISAVCLAIHLHVAQGVVEKISIGAGGVAATPVRARATEAAVRGKPWTLATVKTAAESLRAEFSPISDLRASSAYRSEVLGNLMQRFWLETQGQQQINLESFKLGADA
jgi:xanthine dehydrogenase small subunit